MIRNNKIYSKKFKKGLYIVSTPIGNLDDFTLRAKETLENSDYILCEDTRVSKVLFEKYEIKKKLISYHKFNEKKKLLKVIDLLKKGCVISLVSDAGTPCVSDPGTILVKECIKNDLDVIPIPGASSVISAVSVSGFSEKFFFYGFFPEKNKDLVSDLKELSNLNCSIVFFITSKKFNKILSPLKKYFYGRRILVCREMTKYYEEFIRTEIDSLKEFDFKLKGELTIVISEKLLSKKSSHILDESDKKIMEMMINKLSIKEITSLINKNKKISKKEIYNYCLRLKNEN